MKCNKPLQCPRNKESQAIERDIQSDADAEDDNFAYTRFLLAMVKVMAYIASERFLSGDFFAACDGDNMLHHKRTIIIIGKRRGSSRARVGNRQR